MASLCNPPSLSLPQPPSDILAVIVAALAALGVQIPKLPTIPIPPGFCPLD